MNSIHHWTISTGVLALALLGVGCQHPTATSQAATATAAEPVVTETQGSEKPLPVLFSAADTVTGPMRELLREYDLAELWQGNTKERRDNPTLQGFFGPDHYRFAMVFTKVEHDAQQPEVYHVWGKCRYRKNIRHFSGTLTVRQVADNEPYYSPADASFWPADTSLAPDTTQARYERALSKSSSYTLRAQLHLREEAAENSGLFEGEAVLNFYTAPGKRVGYTMAPYVGGDGPAHGSSLLLRGARRNLTTRQIKQFVVADDAFAAAPDVLKDFGIGERGGEINPKYAKLGWSELWENDEWWADSPRPTLSASLGKH